MVDAYQDITIPFQMSSAEFFREVRDHLNPGGVMVVNMNMRSDQPEGIDAWLTDTIASVFPNVATADVPGNTNRELFASADADIVNTFRTKAGSAEDPALKALSEEISAAMVVPETGDRIFTDDKAPVELLGMREIDDLIADELGYYKQILKRDGIRGLMNEL